MNNMTSVAMVIAVILMGGVVVGTSGPGCTLGDLSGIPCTSNEGCVADGAAPGTTCVEGVCVRPSTGTGGSTGSTTSGTGGAPCTGPTEATCSGQCVDTAIDDKNCGACSKVCIDGFHCVQSLCERGGSGGAGGTTTTGTGGQGGSGGAGGSTTTGTGGQGGSGGAGGSNPCDPGQKLCGSNPAVCTAQTVENGCNAQACDAPCFKANNTIGSTCQGPGGSCDAVCEPPSQMTPGHKDCDNDKNSLAGNGCEYDLFKNKRCTCPGDGNPDCPNGLKCGTELVNGVWMPVCK